ncbi:MAG: substrate-binding domain-containing protein, partial [Planctomycetes bacterium]|nr:substrate-binding domain-containing protein [Planctomycetota bacterium]
MRTRPRTLLAFAFAAAALVLGAWLWARSHGATSVVLATTTSTYDSGLLDRVLPWWSARSGVRVDVLSLGTGQALDVAGRGGADLVLVHAREKELAFVASGQGIHRVGVMYNDFVIVGPPSDPARAREAGSVPDAFRAIHASGRRGEALFVSRADQSGTYAKELALWREAGLSLGGKSDPWYLEAGAGMGAVLRMAEERGAYVLTDRGTF